MTTPNPLGDSVPTLGDENEDGDSLNQEDAGAAFHYKPGQSMGYLMRDCYRFFARRLDGRISAHGVKMGQWYFLRELWEEDGLTQRELSNRVGMMEPTTVVAIRGMVKAGQVTRIRDTEDRRKVRILLTPEGRRLKNQLLPFAREVNENATLGLSKDEIRQLRILINRMKENLLKQ